MRAARSSPLRASVQQGIRAQRDFDGDMLVRADENRSIVRRYWLPEQDSNLRQGD